MKEVIMKVPSFSADYPKAPIYVADLVRCKECKYYIDYINMQFVNAPTLCGRLSTLDNYVAIDANDFCSYGERRE